MMAHARVKSMLALLCAVAGVLILVAGCGHSGGSDPSRFQTPQQAGLPPGPKAGEITPDMKVYRHYGTAAPVASAGPNSPSNLERSKTR